MLAIFFFALSSLALGVMPGGVVQPAPGVYPSVDEQGCCWLRPSAVFTIVQPPHTGTLVLDFVIPPFAAAPKPTTLTIAIGSTTRSACCFGIGESQTAVPLPPAQTVRELRVRVDSSTSFVPAERGLNADRRVLAILLKRVTTVDSATGDVYLGASPVSSAELIPRARVVADAIGLALAAGLLLFFWRRVKAAWLAVLVAAPFLLPVPIGSTTLTLEKVVVIVAALGVLAHARARAAVLALPGRWILGALVLFALDLAVSSAGAPFRGAAIRETLKGAEYALVFAVVFSAYRTDPDEDALQRALIALTCVVALLAFAQPFFEQVQRTIVFGQALPRIAGPLEGPNQLGAFFGIVLVALIALSPRVRPSLTVALVLGIAALLLTFSRAGVVSFAFGAAIAIALKYRPRRATLVVCAAAAISLVVLIGTIAATLNFPNVALDRFFGGTDAYNGGLGSRAALWHAAVELWRTHPLLGVGPGNYELLVGRMLPGVHTHPNGYVFQVLAEQGAIGIVSLLLLIFVPAAIFVRNLGSRFGIAGFAVLATLTFHQLVDGLWPYPKVGIEFWAVLAIAAAALPPGGRR